MFQTPRTAILLNQRMHLQVHQLSGEMTSLVCPPADYLYRASALSFNITLHIQCFLRAQPHLIFNACCFLKFSVTPIPRGDALRMKPCTVHPKRATSTTMKLINIIILLALTGNPLPLWQNLPFVPWCGANCGII